VLISTPGFCQTAVCGPVLELLMSEQANFPAIRMVHAEVYKDPQQFAAAIPKAETTGAVKAYGLSYEPSLIVANADGIVVSRLDFTWDRASCALRYSARRSVFGRKSGQLKAGQLKDCPQPQVRCALGLLIEKPAPWRPSL
jgi:hypothetical protein